MRKNISLALLFAVASLDTIAAVSAPAGISEALRAAPGEEPAFVLNARGAQIYECRARGDNPAAYAWAFIEPEAVLSEHGETVGFHGAGPVWQSALDASSVKGVVRASQDGGAGNIAWLLLAGSSSGSPGRFEGVTSIQRVATQGGVAPAEKCDASAAGRRVRVRYSADYYFYKARPKAERRIY